MWGVELLAKVLGLRDTLVEALADIEMDTYLIRRTILGSWGGYGGGGRRE